MISIPNLYSYIYIYAAYTYIHIRRVLRSSKSSLKAARLPQARRCIIMIIFYNLGLYTMSFTNFIHYIAPQKELSKRMKSRLVIIECAGYIFLAVVFASAIYTVYANFFRQVIHIPCCLLNKPYC